MAVLTALVNPVRSTDFARLEQRAATRQPCHLEGVSRPLDAANGMAWGAIVQDISSTGLSLSLCYPFRPGTYLVIDLHGDAPRSLLARVIHAQDQCDGTWHIGCELVKKLTDSEVDLIV